MRFLMSFMNLETKYKKNIGLLIQQGGGRNRNPQQLNAAGGSQIFFLSYASPLEGLERVVMNFIIFHILIMYCTQVHNIRNYNFVLQVRH